MPYIISFHKHGSFKNWVLAIDALHGNPFDGHTLKQSLDQVKRITGSNATT
jgi:hypothetical protein